MQVKIDDYNDIKNTVSTLNLPHFHKVNGESYDLLAVNGDLCYVHRLDIDDKADYDAVLAPSANPRLSTKTNSFSSNITDDGKILYTKVHGVKANVAANSTHVFKLPIPYTEVYFQGAEILVDIVSVSNFTIDHPVAGLLEQYGYNVNMGKIIYKREARYAARLPQGIEITCEVTNDTDQEQEMGVNFALHEIRDPQGS